MTARRFVLLALALLVLDAARCEAQSQEWDPRDVSLFEAKVRWGARERLDTLPLGEAIARVGLSFVGTPYQANSLEQPGPEHVVVNLHGLDCVTFVESVLALTRFIRHDGVPMLATPQAARRQFESYLSALRYRGGTVDGYASRLHYFSEWLLQGEASGRLELLTASLGGIPSWQVINFMSTHASAYPALGDSLVRARIAAVESALSESRPLAVVPKGWITSEVAKGIRQGDVIAMAASTPGLDIVHTGLAVWRNGALHLLHAPLAGGNVEVSERPLADRLQRLRGQSGIIVARPVDPSAGAGATAPGGPRDSAVSR